MSRDFSEVPKTLTVVVGSTNPVKISAARQAVATLFPDHLVLCEGMDAPSGVSEQPMTAEETRTGAINRTHYCRRSYTETHRQPADFYLAMEGGVDCSDEEGPATFAYVVVADQDRQSVGRSAYMPLPRSIYDDLKAGAELGPLIDRRFNTRNIKQKGGAIGLLTQGKATRESIYTQALILAFVPFIHPNLYQD